MERLRDYEGNWKKEEEDMGEKDEDRVKQKDRE